MQHLKDRIIQYYKDNGTDKLPSFIASKLESAIKFGIWGMDIYTYFEMEFNFIDAYNADIAKRQAGSKKPKCGLCGAEYYNRNFKYCSVECSEWMRKIKKRQYCKKYQMTTLLKRKETKQIKKEMELNKIYNGDCIELAKQLPDNSIDCIVTSPPYYFLRDYGVEGQIGLEKDLNEYIDKLVSLFVILLPKLKDTATVFINIDDTFNNQKAEFPTDSKKSLQSQYQKKSMMLIPYIFAEKLCRYYALRNIIIWHKIATLPREARGRFMSDFEPILFFVKDADRYYFKQQYTPYKTKNKKLRDFSNVKHISNFSGGDITKKNFFANEGAIMRTVWSVSNEPNHTEHLACYPKKLVARMLKSGCPEGGVVLDPFMGSGTTAVVAKQLNMNYIGFELNSDYIKIANKRLNNEIGFL